MSEINSKTISMIFIKNILFSIIFLSFLNADIVYISTENNSSKTTLHSIKLFSCEVIIGNSLRNINDSPVNFLYISKNDLNTIPLIDDHEKLYISSDINTSKIIAYGSLIEKHKFFTSQVIFPKKNICYQKLFKNEDKYVYTLKKGYQFKNESNTQVISDIHDSYNDSINQKIKSHPFVHFIIKDQNNSRKFYPFLTLSDINSRLWVMHLTNKYSKNYKKLLEKFKPKITDIDYFDTLAWVYSDNNNSKKALNIYEEKILPILNKDINHSVIFDDNYQKLQSIYNERLK